MSKLAIDTKVQIEFLTNAKHKMFLDCYVETSEKDRMILKYPSKGGEYSDYLKEGTKVKAFIYTYTGIWIISSMIIEPPKDGLLTLEFKEEHQVIQRRKYFRIFFVTDLYIYLPDKKIKTETIDISGGGVRFLSEEAIKQGEQYNAVLVLGENQEIPVMGRILKKSPAKPKEYVMEFTAIIEKEREKIIKKCVLVERERNKKF